MIEQRALCPLLAQSGHDASPTMSAFGGKADIKHAHVRFLPKANIRGMLQWTNEPRTTRMVLLNSVNHAAAFRLSVELTLILVKAPTRSFNRFEKQMRRARMAPPGIKCRVDR